MQIDKAESVLLIRDDVLPSRLCWAPETIGGKVHLLQKCCILQCNIFRYGRAYFGESRASRARNDGGALMYYARCARITRLGRSKSEMGVIMLFNKYIW